LTPRRADGYDERMPEPKADAAPRSRDPRINGFIKETGRDAGYRKAAQFLVILGKEEASKVLRHLAPEEVEGIALEIARIEHIESREAAKILEEFGYIRETRDLIAIGGLEKAKEMLLASLPPEKAERILEKVHREMAPPPFSFLQDIDIHQASAIVREESPPAVALVLAHLEPRVAARIFAALAPEAQHEVALRIAKMGKVDPEVVRRAEETLRRKVRSQGRAVTQEIDGRDALTKILRLMDPAKEQAILEGLDPNMAADIRKQLYTIDMVLRIPDKELQTVLRDYADREIALMLKACEEPVRGRILDSVSERRRDFIRMEMDALGEVRRTDAETAVGDFLGYLQLLEQKGELTIVRETEEYV
jgi:flagellar motor switch protein FliG